MHCYSWEAELAEAVSLGRATWLLDGSEPQSDAWLQQCSACCIKWAMLQHTHVLTVHLAVASIERAQRGAAAEGGDVEGVNDCVGRTCMQRECGI